MNRRVAIRTIVGLAVSTVSVVAIAQSADIPAAVSRIATVDQQDFVIPALVVVAQMWIRSARWASLISAVGPVALSAGRLLWPLTVGYIGNLVLPARLGEMVRIVMVVRRDRVPATAATASVFVERAIDLLALLAFAAAAVGLTRPVGLAPFLGTIALLLVLVVVLRSAGWIALHFPAAVPVRARDVALRLLGSFKAARPLVVARAWALSVAAWFCDALVMYLCAAALDIPLSPVAAVLLSSGAAVGAALPAAAAALGTYELGAIAVSALAGAAADEALQVAIMAHIVGTMTLLTMGLVGGIASVLTSRPSMEGGTSSADAQAALAAESFRVTPPIGEVEAGTPTSTS